MGVVSAVVIDMSAVVIVESAIVVAIIRARTRWTGIGRTRGHADRLTSAVMAVTRRRRLLIIMMQIVVSMVRIVVTVRRSIIRIIAIRSVRRVVVIPTRR